MRQSPLLQSLLLLACLAVLLLPMLHLTGAEKPPLPSPKSVEESVDSSIASQLNLRFAHAPISVSLMVDGREIWHNNGVQATTYATGARLPFVKGAVEIQLQVQWPDGTPETVAEVEVAPDGFDTIRRSAWGRGKLTDYLVFKTQ